MVDSLSNDVEPVLLAGMKNLLEGRNCNQAVAFLDTCKTNQLEATSIGADQPSDSILNHSKQPLCISSSSGAGPTTSSSSSNSSSTLDTESFHTVFNDSSSASIVVEEATDKKPTQPCSITEPSGSPDAAVNQAQADSKASEADDVGVVESSSTLKTCTLNTFGVVLIIQSADSEAVSYYVHFCETSW